MGGTKTWQWCQKPKPGPDVEGEGSPEPDLLLAHPFLANQFPGPQAGWVALGPVGHRSHCHSYWRSPSLLLLEDHGPRQFMWKPIKHLTLIPALCLISLLFTQCFSLLACHLMPAAFQDLPTSVILAAAPSSLVRLLWAVLTQTKVDRKRRL